MRTSLTIGLAVTALAALTIGCVKIETGPQTTEEARDTSSNRARSFQVEWASRLQSASPIEKVSLMRMLIDSVAASYVRYGHTVSDEWRKGSTGRGTAIPDAEMQATVQRWNEPQQPLMKAYDEVIENGIDQIQRANAFDRSLLGKLAELRDHYYKVSSAVFFPAGGPDEYDNKLVTLGSAGARISSELEQDMRRFK